MEFAKKAEFFSVFVKNGIDRKIAKGVKPDAVINSIKDLLRLMNK
jgi:phosphoglycolate phosphatase-like HAD superfamily hydrolase